MYKIEVILFCNLYHFTNNTPVSTALTTYFLPISLTMNANCNANASNANSSNANATIVSALNPAIIHSCSLIHDMKKNPVVAQYYVLQDTGLDTSPEAKKIYVQAKQIMLFYCKPFNNNYQDYVEWMFKKLDTIKRPSDALYPLMERFLQGEIISFETLFDTMSIEEMNYLGD